MKTVGLSDRRTLPNERNLTIKTFCTFVIIFWRSIDLKCLFKKSISKITQTSLLWHFCYMC